MSNLIESDYSSQAHSLTSTVSAVKINDHIAQMPSSFQEGVIKSTSQIEEKSTSRSWIQKLFKILFHSDESLLQRESLDQEYKLRSNGTFPNTYYPRW